MYKDEYSTDPAMAVKSYSKAEQAGIVLKQF